VQIRAGRCFPLFALALAVTLLPAAAARAADEAPGPLADTWLLYVKPGHAAAFEAGIKAHLAWRKSAGEPFTWRAYQPIVGDDLAHFVFRAEGHHWKDLDANMAWEMKSGSNAKFDEQVAPHMEKAEHRISMLDGELSSFKPDPEFRYFGVTFATIRPGMRADLVEAITKVHKAAMAAKWSRSYSIAWTIGGDGGMTIVSPYKSFADMAEPDPSFMKVVADSLGSAGAAAAFKQIGTSWATQRYAVYAARPDLSTQP
jgi:hypothetical protein